MATPATNRQIPDNAILDHFNKQVYLGNKFKYVLSSTAGGTSETAQLLLTNPAVTTAAFPNQVALFVDLRRLTGLTAASTNVMKVYLNPTVTGAGTPVVPLNLRPASSNVAVAALASGPTVSANGSLVEALAAGALASNSSNDLIILDPGKSLLITLQSPTSAVIDAELSWYEL